MDSMKRSVLFLCLLSLLFGLSACNLPQKAEEIPQSPTDAVLEAPDEAPADGEHDAAEPEPTETPLPAMEKVVFVLPDAVSAAGAFLTQARSVLEGEGYDCSSVASAAEIPAEADYAVLADTPADLQSLRDSLTDTRLIVVAASASEIDGVWTLLFDEAYLPFIAGAALELNAYDRRGAALLPSDSAVWGSHADEAFMNGAQFICGDCRGQLSPYVNFPLVFSLPADSSPDTWAAQIDEAQKSFIYTAFLAEESVSESLTQKLITANVLMLGNGAMPAGAENNWLGTLNLDFAGTLRQIIANCEAGVNSGAIGAELSINPGSLSEDFSVGKSDYLQQIYAMLLSGELSPYDAVTEYSGE